MTLIHFLTSKNPRNINPNFTCHRESTHKQPDVSPSDHDGLAAVGALRLPGVLVLPCRPDADEKDQQIEDSDSHKPLYVDGHYRRGLPLGTGRHVDLLGRTEEEEHVV